MRGRNAAHQHLTTMSNGKEVVVIGTKRLPADKLLAKGRNHISMLSGNPLFPELQSVLPHLAAACDALDTAEQHYQFNRGRIDRVTRSKAQAWVVTLIRRLGAGVQNYAHGSREAILSAGFATKRKHSPSQPMTAPPRLRATRTDHQGCVRLNWGAVRNKRTYSIDFTLGDHRDPTGWKHLVDTGYNYYTVTHLPSDAIVSFRIIALGVQGPGPASDVATVKVP